MMNLTDRVKEIREMEMIGDYGTNEIVQVLLARIDELEAFVKGLGWEDD